MPGGTFDRLAGKTRPGTYINMESARSEPLGGAERGTMLIPLLNHPYGPEKKFITLSNASPDAGYKELGFSVFDPQLLLVREGFKRARRVIVYIPKTGAKATATIGALTATAAHGGSR